MLINILLFIIYYFCVGIFVLIILKYILNCCRLGKNIRIILILLYFGICYNEFYILLVVRGRRVRGVFRKSYGVVGINGWINLL